MLSIGGREEGRDGRPGCSQTPAQPVQLGFSSQPSKVGDEESGARCIARREGRGRRRAVKGCAADCHACRRPSQETRRHSGSAEQPLVVACAFGFSVGDDANANHRKLRPPLPRFLLAGTVCLRAASGAKGATIAVNASRAGRRASWRLRAVSGWLSRPGWVSWRRHSSGAGGVAGVGVVGVRMSFCFAFSRATPMMLW